MKDKISISMIQVSPLLVENHIIGNDKGNNRTTSTSSTNLQPNKLLSSPVVKMNLSSMLLQVIWDDDPALNNSVGVSVDGSEQNINSHKFRVKSGTAFVGIHSDQREFKKRMIERINFVRDKLELSDRMDDSANQTEQTKQLKMILPIINLPSEDPTDIYGIPCLVRVYSGLHHHNISRYNPIQSDLNMKTQTQTPLDVDGALIHILPALNAKAVHKNYQLCCIEAQVQNQLDLSRLPKCILKFPHSLENLLTGICELNNGSKEGEYDERVLSSFETETIRSLVSRMNNLLDKPILVGTTSNAKIHQENNNDRRRKMHKVTKQYWGSNKMKNKTHVGDRMRPSLIGDDIPHEKSETYGQNILDCDGALTVYNSIHGSGKTALVTAIARSVLHCQAVHIVSGSILFSKFGAYTDIVLQSLLHQIIISAAIKGNANGEVGSICIILDQLDTFVPSNLSGAGGKGDASLPALMAIGDYFSKIVHSIKAKRYFPAPRKNSFYNIGETKGFLFPIKLCIVGVVTNSVDDVPKVARMDTNFRTVLNLLGQNRYRVPKLNVPSDETMNDETHSKHHFFDMIGGNHDAKRALEDVLALDKRKKSILSKFGLSLPTGILLYGPPGTGKTLLAKAVSQVMIQVANKSGNASGGTFISLKASDIVSSEVGQSEKLLSSTFETARKRSPSVIFIDEFQALFTSRDKEDGTGGKGSGRLASTLLTLMDDVTKWKDANETIVHTTNGSGNLIEKNRVIVLAATNTPWMVDRAFLRSGRFDRVIYVGLPTLSERESILKVHVSQMKIHPNSSVEKISQTMAKLCEGFSGADLSNLVRAAAIRCILSRESHVSIQHFLDTRQHDFNQPSSDSNLLRRLSKWKP